MLRCRYLISYCCVWLSIFCLERLFSYSSSAVFIVQCLSAFRTGSGRLFHAVGPPAATEAGRPYAPSWCRPWYGLTSVTGRYRTDSLSIALLSADSRRRWARRQKIAKTEFSCSTVVNIWRRDWHIDWLIFTTITLYAYDAELTRDTDPWYWGAVATAWHDTQL